MGKFISRFRKEEQNTRTPPPILPDRPNNYHLPQVAALYNYQALCTGDLSFKKGDTLEVIIKDDTDWWHCRNKRTKQEGIIPSNYVAEIQSLNVKDWYFGDITRIKAELELKSPGNDFGSYLIRDSESLPGGYALSLLDYDKTKSDKIVKHYRIKTLDRGGFFITPRTTFKTLDQLVAHYTTANDGLSRKLAQACKKDAPVTHDLDRATKDNWEVERKDVILGERLGSGMFGEVRKATYRGKIVAVKTLKEGTMPKEKFMEEANAMKNLKHPNIVSLFAVCSREEPIYILTEFMDHGSLLSFLKCNRGKKLKVLERIEMGAQIANGMSFIEGKKYCHRDLAARNVLVSGRKLTCKVADFGLSRAIDNDVYVAAAGAKFPIKWTAPEAIAFGKFTIKSDVWSFGIVLIEIFTHGAYPYPGISNNGILNQIEAGYRLPKPDICPVDLYESVFLKCWEANPDDRPTFEFLEDWMSNYQVSSETQYQEQ
ncbi:DgyrCDS1185 [Dimorphilus gyrociliatus]|uniref:Tyrosine-protein kinase n=1 Tax=Dimorphilus gyrociliatus TaxID=2664684 RepID=A0A7I8V6I2_9ANNE|nr:DgyrCDS1185 [Dimorphilus gyrociliatus]